MFQVIDHRVTITGPGTWAWTFRRKPTKRLIPWIRRAFGSRRTTCWDDMLDYAGSPASSPLLRLPSASAWRPGWRR